MQVILNAGANSFAHWTAEGAGTSLDVANLVAVGTYVAPNGVTYALVADPRRIRDPTDTLLLARVRLVLRG